MPSKISPANTHPALGTVIDDGALELVEVLGVGGYGVVYRAVVVGSSPPQSLAVKCLYQGDSSNSRKRHLHVREIMLHRLAGAHPNVVTLHKVVDEGCYTYLILDFASAHDLFTQILHGRQYLGNDDVIRHIFLQLLDAVEYCHSLGIYHRDLKPENILCFDNGLRVAITDFGLATTDKMSMEFRTGSIYHMSPECHGPSSYSPAANDIWSLGIILINLITGRNPFRSSSMDDPTFQCFLHNPMGFLPTVLPLSTDVNSVLTQMLAIDWRDRPSLNFIRQAIMDIPSFYSPGAILDGSMARCPWEAPMDVDDDEDLSGRQDSTPVAADHPVPTDPTPEDSSSSEESLLRSHWSQESTELTVPAIARPDSLAMAPSKEESRPSQPPTSFVDESVSLVKSSSQLPSRSSSSSERTSSEESMDLPSWPITPGSKIATFAEASIAEVSRRQPLTIDTTVAVPRKSCSVSSSMVFTALDALNKSFSFSASPDKGHQRMSGIEIHNPWDPHFDQDVEFFSPSDWKMVDPPFSGIPATPVSHSTSCTTLSSFCAPCASFVFTMSSQDSLYSYAPPHRGRTNLFTNSQPFRLPYSSTNTNTNNSSGNGSPHEPTNHSFGSLQGNDKWTSDSDTVTSWQHSDAATTLENSFNDTIFGSTPSLELDATLQLEELSAAYIWPSADAQKAETTAGTATSEPQVTPSTPSPTETLQPGRTPATPRRASPFRWLTEFKRANLFA